MKVPEKKRAPFSTSNTAFRGIVIPCYGNMDMRTQQCYTIFYLAFILISLTSNRRKRTVCAVHSIFHFVFSFFFSKHQDSRHGCSKSFCSFFVHRATHAASMKEKKKKSIFWEVWMLLSMWLLELVGTNMFVVIYFVPQSVRCLLFHWKKKQKISMAATFSHIDSSFLCFFFFR